MFDLEEELAKLPGKPGVYLMHDAKDKIIYVGKAVSLKNRVRQYFQASRNVTPKIAKMISQIDHFEYIITDSEVEALALECNLIKEHRPRYNTMLTDDKAYPYVKATIQDAYPRLIYAHQMKKDGCRYFGPYTSSGAAKDTLDLVKKIYHIRTCSRRLPKDTKKERPCLNYHIRQCDAPCQGYISEADYKANFEKALRLLEGDNKELLSILNEKMTAASEKMEFEEAANWRDLMNSVRQMSIRQKVSGTGRKERDIIAMAKAGNEAVVQVFFIREGKMIGRDHFYLKGVLQEEKSAVLSAFIKQFYSGTPFLPKELIVECEIDDSEAIGTWLSAKKGQKVHILTPQKGEKQRLVDLAHKNASLVLIQDSEKIKREEERTSGAAREIADWMGLGDIHRIESFDISNINGFQSVGSMVVFEDGRPKRSDYRKFKIKTVTGPDDYASMEEVLTRRFLHGINEHAELSGQNLDAEKYGSFTRFPDLIMMDGGKGQVHIAEAVLSKLQLHIPVCGMIKDDHHRTRGIFYREQELPVKTDSEGFHLMTRIQDETHRFAIEYHRSLRGKTQVKSVLDDISGIGAARRRALMKHFKSIEAIREASVEEIAQAESMNTRAAQAVYDFFHKKG